MFRKVQRFSLEKQFREDLQCVKQSLLGHSGTCSKDQNNTRNSDGKGQAQISHENENSTGN